MTGESGTIPRSPLAYGYMNRVTKAAVRELASLVEPAHGSHYSQRLGPQSQTDF